MITRGLRAAAVLALCQAESEHWNRNPLRFRDVADRWEGYQWNMVRHMVQDGLWEELTYHLTHNVKDTYIRREILQVLWTAVPRLCTLLELDHL